MRNNFGLWLRIGFGIFLAIWGLEFVLRADYWATESYFAHYYGNVDLISNAFLIAGVIQLIIAISFFVNSRVKCSSIVLFIFLIISTIATLGPLINYLVEGGYPIPALLFSYHFPLLAGSWALISSSHEPKRATVAPKPKASARKKRK